LAISGQRYQVLTGRSHRHALVFSGSGKKAVRLFAWFQSFLAQVNGNLRGIYHGVREKHLSRCLAEFC
jgi:hypothetical protein